MQVSSITNNAASIILRGNMQVKSFSQAYSSTMETSAESVVDISGLDNGLNIAGTLDFTSTQASYSSLRFSAGDSTANVSVGGISGGIADGSVSGNTKITTAISSGATTITITGTNSVQIFGGSLTDRDLSSSIDTTGGELSVVMNASASSVQYLAGMNSYRGDTVVNSGTLYLNAMAGGDGSGIGDVYLKGGALGTCGVYFEGKFPATSTMTVQDFSWSGREIIVKIDGASSDNVSILGDFIKAGSDGKFNFKFEVSNFDEVANSDNSYKIISFSDSTSCDFTEDDFSYSGDVASVVFSVRQGDGVYASITVPEPSSYAACAALLALAFAFLRRRKNA